MFFFFFNFSFFASFSDTAFLTYRGSSFAAYSQEKGKASYYSKNINGRKMSSGLRYHRDSMFCAHRKHPFGTLLKVTNPKNGKSVVVKVTDRGPYGRGRIIDLSYGAAKELGILTAGVAMVAVSVYKENKGIPFKPDDYTNELPELDYEITDGDNDDYTPEWRMEKKDTDGATTEPQDKQKKGTTHTGKEKQEASAVKRKQGL